MSHFGIFSFVSAVLQLTVPGYSLRLVRRFGAERTGWFVVLSFSAMAFLYWIKPSKLMSGGTDGGMSLDIVYGLASVLLVIGMGHVETLCRTRQQAEKEEAGRRKLWEQRLMERNAQMTIANDELTAEVTRLIQSERALRESDRQHRFLFAENPQPMWVFDLRSLRFLAVNKAAMQMYGYSHEEFMGLNPRKLLPVEGAANFALDLSRPCTTPEARGTWRHVNKEKGFLDVEITEVDIRYEGNPARLVLAQDVSQRRRLDSAARDAQRMAVTGQVAGGVAHHMNNLLMVMQGHTDLLKRQEHDAKSTGYIDRISTAIDTAAGVTKSLLTAGGREILQTEAIDLSARVQSMQQPLRRLAGQNVDVQFFLAPNPPHITADPGMIDMILKNLMTNAREAMPGGGTVSISVSALRLDEKTSLRHHDARPGGFVRLTFRDTGAGMSQEVKARMFEPFYTTHDVGQGMGLGLSCVLGAVKQHSGWIEVSSELNSGSEFRIYFPVASVAERVPAVIEFVKPPSRESVLLVEPDDRARCLARFILSGQGYRVVEADSAPTALTIWSSQCSTISLAIVNVVLHEGTPGSALIRELRHSNANLKALFVSPPPAEGEETSTPAPEGHVAIVKPYKTQTLIAAVQSVLGGGK